jgi:hypothetical protein
VALTQFEYFPILLQDVEEDSVMVNGIVEELAASISRLQEVENQYN